MTLLTRVAVTACWLGAVLTATMMALHAQVSSAIAPASDPSSLFHPQVSLNAAERARLDAGETIVKSVTPVDGQVAIFSAARTTVTGDRLVRWVHRIDAMKRGRYAPAVVRFSDPPRLEDLATLELDADDLDALRGCRPGACDLKLSERDIQVLAPLARGRAPGWQTEVQQAFRQQMLARAKDYLANGFASTPPYRDGGRPVRLEDEFRGLLAQSAFLPRRLPLVADFLTRYPAAPASGIDSFLYWSKEILGRKPVVSITHVTVHRPSQGADAVVVSRQVYASHYMSGSLAVTAIVGGEGAAPGHLVYLNRSRVDVLDGLFGGLVRRIVERRLRDEADQVVDGLRQRLERGEPPT